VREAVDQHFSDTLRDLASPGGKIADLRRLIERLGGSPMTPPQGRASAGTSADSPARDLATLRSAVDNLRQIAWQLAVRRLATCSGRPDGERACG
jgi:hypothetical protein